MSPAHQINNLEAQLEAQKTKTSILQQRLVSTLDTLDHLQTQYSLELDTEAGKIRHMETKLRRYLDTVQAAEVERDDLRDAVMKLVMKVESGNDDFNSWPRSHMHISSLLGPAALTSNHMQDQAASKDGSTEQLLSYASAIIDTLRHERDLARAAHAHSCNMFEGRIHILEAQLARRDVEIEAHAEHVGRFPLMADATVRQEMHEKKRSKMHPVSMAQEEVMTMMQRTVARNKTLEEEIKGLFKQLEQARIRNSTSLPLPIRPSIERTPTELRAEASLVQAPSTELDSPLAPPASSTTDTHAVDSQSPHITFNPDIATKMADRNIHDRHHHHQTVSHLNQQIAELSATIDAFKAERDSLWELITSRRDVAALPSVPLYRQHSPELELGPEAKRAMIQPRNALEDECISLRHAVCQLREELHETKKSAEDREEKLLEQIEQLRKAQWLTDTAQNADDLTIRRDHIPNTDDLLNAYDGEMSMDLATPLFPISLLPPLPPRPAEPRPQSRPSRPQTQSLHPESVPISSEEEGNQTPRMIPPRILSSSPSLTRSSSSTTPPLSPTPHPPLNPALPTFILNSPSVPILQIDTPPDPILIVSVPRASMEQVERELVAEQLRLQEGEQQLAELQNVLQNIHEHHRMSSLR